MTEYHNPVMLKESIEGLNINPEGVYVDVTFGGGGHSRAILEKLTTGKLYAFDQDEDAVRNKIPDERFQLIQQNFKYLKNFLKMFNATPVDGLLADLGVSSYQFDVAERGFSTRFDADLDMRMNRSSKLTAEVVINTYAEEKLRTVFKEYGEVDNAAKLARLIVSERKTNPIKTIAQLREVIKSCVRKDKENQYLAQVFQALRIEVNNELDALKQLLTQSQEVLKQGGRLVVISYHSLEDRLVKNYIRSGKFEGDAEQDFFGNRITPFKAITRKPISPSEEEIKSNNRGRSAKLRIAEKN